MALPKQVRQQIADANRIESELRAAQEPAPPAPAEPVPPVVNDPPSDPPVVAQAPEAPAAPEPQPAPAPAPQPEVQYDTLLQQYRTLQGIHRTMSRNNTELQSQVQTLQASVQTLSAELDQLRQRAAQPASTSVSPEEVAEYGPDLISIIERKAREVAAPLNDALAQMKTRNAELEQSLSNLTRAQVESSGVAFESRLAQLVPDLNALNYDQNFLSWLSQVDPLDARRKTFQERLNDAVELGDADTAASFFNMFKSLVARAAPTPAPAPKPNLAAQAQPTSRAAPDGATAPVGKQWTQTEIQAFYNDVARGRITPQEKARIEKEIFSAGRDNRIAA